MFSTCAQATLVGLVQDFLVPAVGVGVGVGVAASSVTKAPLPQSKVRFLDVSFLETQRHLQKLALFYTRVRAKSYANLRIRR